MPLMTSGNRSSGFDVVVVGAGHNQLTTAAYLASAGLGVCVLEAQSDVGGGAVTREVTLPGFKHDLHATGVVHLQGHPLLKNDELGLKSRFGLGFAYPDSSFMTVFDDGDTLSCYMDLDRTCADIARFSQKDAESYRQLAKWMEKMNPIIGMSMGNPPMPFGRFINLLEQSDDGNAMIDIMFKSAYDITLQYFDHPKVRMHFLKWCAEMSCGIEEKTTGMTLLFLIGSSHTNPAGCAVGGTAELSRSMVKCIEFHGGEVRFDSPVRKIINRSGRAAGVELESGELVNASRAVVAGIHPHHLADFVDGLDDALLTRARQTENSTFGGFLVHAALREAPVWKAGKAPEDCLCINMVDYGDMEDFRRLFDDLRYGELPKHFCGYTSTHTRYDPSRAPDGQHTLYFYTWAPLKLRKGGHEAWEDIAAERAEWMMSNLQRYCPNVSGDNILKMTTESPLDMSRHSPSFRFGDPTGLAMFIYQFFGRRPTPELAQYRVPGAESLYLSGPFMHPGGGLTGGGRGTAIRIMQDLDVDLYRVLSC